MAARFKRPRLDPAAPVSAAFEKLGLAALHQLAANAERLHRQASSEAVHQARVALRRLRTYVAAFEPRIAEARGAETRATLRRLSAIFEKARALDVLVAGALRSVGDDEPGATVRSALLAAQAGAHSEVCAAVGSPVFARDLLAVLRWTTGVAWRRHAKVGGDTLGDAAARLLARRWKALKERARRLDWNDPAALHQLRLQAKRLRYLADVLPAGAGGSELIRRLKPLQAALGALNDAAMAEGTARLALAGLPPDAAFALGVVVGELRRPRGRAIKRGRRALRRLLKHR